MRRLIPYALYCILPSLAHANALDEFGFGARSAGMAGAQTGDAKGFAAAYHNPAGAARSSDVEAALGYGYGAIALDINGRSAGVTTPRGTSLGLTIPIPLGPLQAAFAIALYLPDQFIARIQLVPASEPH